MTPMTGQYSHNIDAKGRLFIPASFRKALGQTFHVTVGQDHCLAVYSDDRWNEYMDKLKIKAPNIKALCGAGLPGPHPHSRQAAGLRGPDQGGRGGGQL